MVVAAIGIATVLVVYLTLGERRQASKPMAGAQLPPRVVAQTTGGQLEHVKGIDSQYRVHSARSTLYDDGSTRGEDITIEAPNRDGRHFIVSASRSYVTKGNSDIELTDSINLREDDGFELKTSKATFNQQSGIARADGDVTFGKGRMTGSGTNVTYDEHADVLDIRERAHVELTAQGAQPATTFNGRSATLDRMKHLLMVAGDVRVTHGEQVITTSSATAHLSEMDDRILFVELREGSRVNGGLGNVESMHARDMDLDYAEDGQTIQHAVLRGQGSVTLAPRGSAAGRQLDGESLEIALRPDQLLDRVTGSGGVSMTMAASEGTPARTVRATTMDAKGGPGGALTSARFVGNVSFEEATDKGSRTATSQTLDLTMRDEAIAGALFTERASFQDGDLKATARDAQYEPEAGKLHLRRPDERGDPRVSDDRVAIDADVIDIELEARGISGKGRVRSALAASRPAADRKDDTHLPGLLQQNKPVQILSDEVSYNGDRGVAVYTGKALLSQEGDKGDTTEIRAQSIELHQKEGDLIARGSVASKIMMDTGVSTGDAGELRYVDDKRTITYISTPPAKAGDAVTPAHVVGSQGDLRARSVTVFLAATESRLEKLEAEVDVVSRIDARTVRGRRLLYKASDESYIVRGTPAVLRETQQGGCRAFTGQTLTFNRSTDRIEVDGESRQYALSEKTSCQ
jgi:lipopolysaccharide export system protein LptA